MDDFRESPCWEWLNGHDGRGYGIVRVKGRARKVHIVMYEISFGPVPAGKELHHRCNNKGCANPSHLLPVTRSEHLKLTYDDKGRVEACKHGHPYDAANTYFWRGQRCCRACNQRYTRVRRTGSCDPAKVYEQRCWKCGHIWSARVERPKQCANPACKVRQENSKKRFGGAKAGA